MAYHLRIWNLYHCFELLSSVENKYNLYVIVKQLWKLNNVTSFMRMSRLTRFQRLVLLYFTWIIDAERTLALRSIRKRTNVFSMSTILQGRTIRTKNWYAMFSIHCSIHVVFYMSGHLHLCKLGFKPYSCFCCFSIDKFIPGEKLKHAVVFHIQCGIMNK